MCQTVVYKSVVCQTVVFQSVVCQSVVCSGIFVQITGTQGKYSALIQGWSAEYSALICGFSAESRAVMASYVASHGWRGWLRRKGKLWAVACEQGTPCMLIHSFEDRVQF